MQINRRQDNTSTTNTAVVAKTVYSGTDASYVARDKTKGGSFFEFLITSQNTAKVRRSVIPRQWGRKNTGKETQTGGLASMYADNPAGPLYSVPAAIPWTISNDDVA